MTASHPLDLALAQVNQRLKAARLGLKIDRRGDRLSLRGTLPPRPGSPKLRSHQQRIPLGLPATKAGLKQIEQEAKLIAARLIQNSFDWRDYLGPVAVLHRAGANLEEQIAAFQQQFFAERPLGNASARTTWEKAYAPYLRKLAAIAAQHRAYSLPEAIYATLQSTRANSRSRQVCCTALNAFAEFLNLALPTELKAYWGRYGSSQTQARSLPTDEQILATYAEIPNPAWQFVYGMMATYGLRNHEVFFCDYRALKSGDSEAIIEVQETTKTGLHDVWPFYPEWVERFNLRQVNLPPVSTDLSRTTLQRVGQQVSTQFRRYQIPFSPYDLRHAWAIRTIHMGLPDTVAAKMMGHSVQIHNRTYHRWISRRDQQAAVTTALSRS
ncbi:site-specific integrase [Romeria aff. gracilis LEGE 07310]|uniref:Site-specific integrase n=1 Tax=Vasconcelosia minhoensis LEGE 07310 TaxID=915328 RepID=A0A8J7DBX3_9CYAN|nr:site-specific integrase [Romeria gracilis]MBE9077063.1 site-specific integrase [Romeria aff. gracilis LEGE 07310]